MFRFEDDRLKIWSTSEALAHFCSESDLSWPLSTRVFLLEIWVHWSLTVVCRLHRFGSILVRNRRSKIVPYFHFTTLNAPSIQHVETCDQVLLGKDQNCNQERRDYLLAQQRGQGSCTLAPVVFKLISVLKGHRGIVPCSTFVAPPPPHTHRHTQVLQGTAEFAAHTFTENTWAFCVQGK